MWQLQPPQRTTNNVFRLCIDRMRQSNLKQRLLQIEMEIDTYSVDYLSKAQSNCLEQLVNQSNGIGPVTVEEMSKLYDAKLGGKPSRARIVRDELLGGAKRCPYCGKGPKPNILDHHLPKSLFPAFALTPINLVPSCYDCNHEKHEFAPQSADLQYLHPYFQNVENVRWLYTRVENNSSLAITFFVQAHTTWNSTLTNRVNHQFKELKLAQRFRNLANEELSEIAHLLFKLWSMPNGATQLRNYLLDCSVSRSQTRLNSWGAAFYEGLATDPWFCTTGAQHLQNWPN